MSKLKKIISITVIAVVIVLLILIGVNFYNKHNNEFINYNITKVTENSELKNDDGITLVSVKYSYPVIENKDNNEFINSINNEYKLEAENFFNKAGEDKTEAQILYENLNEEFRPYTRELEFEVNMNDKGLISIINNNYYYNGGAHGSYIMQSRTFDINNEIELTLEKIINNDVWNIKENVHELFKTKLQKEGLDLEGTWGEILENEVENVNFYLKDGALVFYFNTDQIAPYALGNQIIEVPYDENIFLVDISSDKSGNE